MSLKHPSHVLDDMTGNCTACGASHEYMLDFQNVPCKPDGLPHPRESGFYFDTVPTRQLTDDQVAEKLLERYHDLNRPRPWNGPRFTLPRSHLGELLEEGYARTNESMVKNLYTDLFTDEFGGRQTLPWHKRLVWRLRLRLAERLTDLASWIAGHDMRGDW